MRTGDPYSLEYATNVIIPYEFTAPGALKRFGGFFVKSDRVRIGVSIHNNLFDIVKCHF